MKLVKLFGARRTGTTWSREIFKANFEDVVVCNHELGSKHRAPKNLESIKKWSSKKSSTWQLYVKEVEENKRKIYPYVIIKNPYSWYLSLKEFRKSRFDIKEVKGYSHFYCRMRELEDKPEKYDNIYTKPYFIRYEDLLSDTNGRVCDVANTFSIKLKNNNIIIPNKVELSKAFTPARKDFYLQKGNFGLSNGVIKELTCMIDWELMAFYGYKPMEVV